MNHGKNVMHNAQDLSGKGLTRKMKAANAPPHDCPEDDDEISPFSFLRVLP